MRKEIIATVIVVLLVGFASLFMFRKADVTNNPPAAPAAAQFTFADVETHNSAASCYTVINNNVYDLTSWVGEHPGGKKAILGICGKDGTAAFEGQHGGQPRPAEELAGFQIGVLMK